MQGTRSRSNCSPLTSILGQQQCIVQDREKSSARLLEHLLELVAPPWRDVSENELADAEKSVERCAQLVRDEVQELVLWNDRGWSAARVLRQGHVRARRPPPPGVHSAPAWRQLLVGLPNRLVQPGVLERGGRLARHHAEQVELAATEDLARELLADEQDADELPPPGGDAAPRRPARRAAPGRPPGARRPRDRRGPRP